MKDENKISMQNRLYLLFRDEGFTPKKSKDITDAIVTIIEEQIEKYMKEEMEKQYGKKD